jgi:hypothetical protein
MGINEPLNEITADIKNCISYTKQVLSEIAKMKKRNNEKRLKKLPNRIR